MKRLLRRVLLGGAVLAVAGLVGWWGYNRKARSAFEEQLRLARQEGMVTSAAEFRARIPNATDTENAASIYRNLKGRLPTTIDFADLTKQVAYKAGRHDLNMARKFLQEYRPVLQDLDVAVERPRCWFDRRWEDGAATLMPELAQMKSAARLILLRATVAVADGNSKAAIQDVERTRKLAKHAGEEPTMIARLVEAGIHRMALDALASWSFSNRNQPLYAQLMIQTVQSLPNPNLKEENLGSLYEILSLIDLCSTPEGRHQLGLSEPDISPLEGPMSLLINPWKAKALIVEAERDRWRALTKPDQNLEAELDKATRKLYRGLLAFPTAANLHTMLGSGNDPVLDRQVAFSTGMLRFKALARALSQPKIPKQIDTRDLLSPLDGKPLHYEFNGKQVRIWVSGDDHEGEPVVLKVPPDSVLSKQ
ncbi:MAG TPA: hypothetical protein PKA27_00665 [Fimbriimonadaceae bacterium]|nr:hypothetical protein [Fimbriimonadaceae bacterium]